MAFPNMFGQRAAMQQPGQAAPMRQMPQRPGGMQQAAPQKPQAFSGMGRFGAMRPGMAQAAPQRPQGQFFGQPMPQRQAPRQAPPAGGAMGGVGQMAGAQPRRPQMGGAMGAIGGMLSDESSKEKIRELEGIKERYEALLDTPSATAESFKPATANTYEYKDPTAPGAAPGEHAGPMASELRSIPGVVQRGPDGMDRVDPGRLSLANASAQGETSRELDELKARLAALEDDPDAVLREASGGR